MSLFHRKKIPNEWSNVDIFTFGHSSIYGYDALNHCILISSTFESNNDQNLVSHRYHLSSSPTWPIRRLILNRDETIISLIAEKLAYLVHLPCSNVSRREEGSISLQME